MKIHYNNGDTEKMIDNIIAVQVIGDGYPVIAVTEDDHEYRISLNSIEMIIDNSLSDSEDVIGNSEVHKNRVDTISARYGQWEKVSDKAPKYICTACRHLYNNKSYSYCPNCGAKMMNVGE